MFTRRHSFRFGFTLMSIAVLFLVWGLQSFLYMDVIWGLILIVPSVLVLTFQSGIQINGESRQYRYYMEFFWIKTGDWKPLTPNYIISIEEATSKYFSRRKHVELRLKLESDERLLVRSYSTEERALQDKVALERILKADPPVR